MDAIEFKVKEALDATGATDALTDRELPRQPKKHKKCQPQH